MFLKHKIRFLKNHATLKTGIIIMKIQLYHHRNRLHLDILKMKSVILYNNNNSQYYCNLTVFWSNKGNLGEHQTSFKNIAKSYQPQLFKCNSVSLRLYARSCLNIVHQSLYKKYLEKNTLQKILRLLRQFCKITNLVKNAPSSLCECGWIEVLKTRCGEDIIHPGY